MLDGARAEADRLRLDAEAEAADVREQAAKEAKRLVAKASSRKARRAGRRKQAQEPEAATSADDADGDSSETGETPPLDLNKQLSAAIDEPGETSLVEDLREAWNPPED
jgi:F0F1-type ATP synthase membrane subunit b/b'